VLKILGAVLSWSLDNRLLVLVLTGLLVVTGVLSLERLPIDAFPDTSPTQVQINTVAPSLSPEEIERQITIPVELSLSGTPGIVALRSLSKFGFSQVIVIFDDHNDVYRARQVVGERLQTVDLPDGIGPPEMGPIATGLGEVFHYLLHSKTHDLTTLRTLHDWVVRPILSAVPGVAEVNSWGGLVKQYQVVVDPLRLAKHGLSLEELVEALRKNNANVGGGNLVVAGEQILVHGVGLAQTIKDIEAIPVATFDGTPIHVADLAEVREGHEIRRGAVTAHGEGEVVLGLAFMLAGENSRVVTQNLERKLAEVRRALPEDVELEIVYNRVSLVDGVLATVRTNLLEGALLVVAVLFLLMGNLRAGLIVALAIPLSMLFAFSAMLRFGIAGSLMSLGAIDFGMFVDSSVIMVENSSRRAAEDDGKRPFKEVIREACMEVRRPTLFGEAIVMIVFLPILTLEGIEGKMFRPMALTFLFCLLGSSILSLTLMPTLASFFLKRGGGPRHSFLMSALVGIYRPFLSFALKVPALVVLAAALLVGLTAHLARNLGSEFVPELSEGSIVVNTVRLAGVSLEESVRYGTQLEKVLRREFPDEIDRIWTRTGAPEVATDPMGLEVSDIFIRLNPREAWSKAKTQEELVEKMSATLAVFPGMRAVFTQPIEMRMAEMVAGSRADLAVRVLGDDLPELERVGTEVDALLRTIEGSADVRRDQLTGQPILQAKLNKTALARHGVAGSEVLDLIEAIGGLKVGEIREGERRFDLAVRLDDRYRADPEALRKVLVPVPNGVTLPLEALADLSFEEGPQTIRREWGKRQITIECNVRGRDIGSFVEEAREKILVGVSMPDGYFVEFAGQFEHLIAARRRLTFVVPLSLGLILVLLYMTYRSVRDALLIFTQVPFAMVGGVLALYFRDLPFTISAGVGFIALSGIAIQNGLVVISYTRSLMRRGSALRDALRESALGRLRPVLATALTDVLGFIPMALSTGLGAEVQRPLATVIIGGAVSSTLLTLLVLPAIYSIFGKQLDPLDGEEDFV